MKKKILFLLLLTSFLTILCIAVSASPAVSVTDSKGNETLYESRQEAWADVYDTTERMTFKLLDSWTASPSEGYGTGVGFDRGMLLVNGNITFDLNGCVMNRNCSDRADFGSTFEIVGNSDITLTDSNPLSTVYSDTITGGVITGGNNNSDDFGGALTVWGDFAGTLTVKGVNFAANVSEKRGGAIVIGKKVKGKVIIENTGFYTNSVTENASNSYGGALCILGGDVTIGGCVFESNYSEDYGGAVYIDGGCPVISNTLFKKNVSLDEGGAVYQDYSAKGMTCLSCIFLDNESVNAHGGAVYVNDSDKTLLGDITMKGNRANVDGGGLYVNGNETYICDCTITGNTAGACGGGVYVDASYYIVLQGKAVIKDNIGIVKGPNLYLEENKVKIYSGGLSDGAEVWIYQDDLPKDYKNVVVNLSQSQYVKNYFHFDQAVETEFGDAKDEEIIRAEASVIGHGNNIVFIAAGSVLIAACGVFAALYGSRKRKGKEK